MMPDNKNVIFYPKNSFTFFCDLLMQTCNHVCNHCGLRDVWDYLKNEISFRSYLTRAKSSNIYKIKTCIHTGYQIAFPLIHQ